LRIERFSGLFYLAFFILIMPALWRSGGRFGYGS